MEFFQGRKRILRELETTNARLVDLERSMLGLSLLLRDMEHKLPERPPMTDLAVEYFSDPKVE